MRQSIDITWVSLFRIIAVILLAVTLFYISDVLVIVFFAVIISSALHVPVTYLESKNIPRILSVLVIFLLGAAVIGLILYTLVPVVLIQLKYFFGHLSDIQLPFLEDLGLSQLVSDLDQGVSGWINALFSGGSGALSFLSSVAGNFFSVFVTVVLSFYMTVSKGSIERFLRSLTPTKKEHDVIMLFDRMRRKIGRWFTSQIIVSFFVGALTFVGLVILGVEYALVLALLAALFEIIPYVGPIAVGVISFIVILPQSVTLAFIAVLIFFAIQQIENHLLVPLIVGKAVGFDPVLVVIAILAGSQVSGFVGAILAIPAAIIIQELIDGWSFRKDPPVEPVTDV